MVSEPPPACPWHLIEDAHVVASLSNKGHLIAISGPPGTEAFSRDLLMHPVRTEAILIAGCTCVSPRFVPMICLFRPGPFSRTEYTALVLVRAHFPKGDLSL